MLKEGTYNSEFLGLREWTNKDIINNLRLKDIASTCHVDLSANSFKSYLKMVLPNYLCANFKEEKLLAFLTHAYPPVVTLDKQIKQQFKVEKKCNKYTFHCCICPAKVFEGAKQTYQHAISKSHVSAVNQYKAPEVQEVKRSSNASISSYFLSGKHTKVKCHYIFDGEIVKQFQSDQVIHRMSMSTAFRHSPDLHCSSHSKCSSYDVWKLMHPDRLEKLKTRCSPQAEYIHQEADLSLNGKVMSVHGGIRSIHPPCTGTASSTGNHPFTCPNCQSHLSHLKDLIRKRQNSALRKEDGRLSARGMRNDYLTKGELQKKIQLDKNEVRILKGKTKELEQKLQDAESWANELYQASSDEDKFQVALEHLLKEDTLSQNPVQIDVIRNLVGKLKQGRNHHFDERTKQIGRMFQGWLGNSHYGVLQVRISLK